MSDITNCFNEIKKSLDALNKISEDAIEILKNHEERIKNLEEK